MKTPAKWLVLVAVLALVGTNIATLLRLGDATALAQKYRAAAETSARAATVAQTEQAASLHAAALRVAVADKFIADAKARTADGLDKTFMELSASWRSLCEQANSPFKAGDMFDGYVVVAASPDAITATKWGREHTLRYEQIPPMFRARAAVSMVEARPPVTGH